MIRPALTMILLAAMCAHARADDLRDLCVDRPGKGTSPCTVDAGRFQIEADIANATFANSGSAKTHTYLYANPTVKPK